MGSLPRPSLDVVGGGNQERLSLRRLSREDREIGKRKRRPSFDSVRSSSSSPAHAGAVSHRSDSRRNSSSSPARTRVVLNKGDSLGKLEVMVGPKRSKKAWKPKNTWSGTGKEYELLGNVATPKWEN